MLPDYHTAVLFFCFLPFTTQEACSDRHKIWSDETLFHKLSLDMGPIF